MGLSIVIVVCVVVPESVTAKILVPVGIALNVTTIPLLNDQFAGEVVTVPLVWLLTNESVFLFIEFCRY